MAVAKIYNMAAFLTLSRKDKEEAQASKFLVNIETICSIREAKIDVDGDLVEGSYIETTCGSYYYCLDTIKNIEMALRVFFKQQN